MPVFFTYLLKLTVSLAVVFLFYQFVLRKLTFYNWNRWYLFIYTIACFFIPFIDISPVLHRNQWSQLPIIQLIPQLNDNSTTTNTNSFSLRYWNLLIIFILSGLVFMLCRLLIQLFSFRKMMKKAELISGEKLKIYQVNDPIIPFSFGNSVFINRQLHTPAELEEIIRHEFVHAKQRHSFDIIWGEILCMLNWYNPFAWLLKRSIRQNLEFIADNKVVENGIDKKEYQYLLLKVIGNNQFSIAAQFNFSSLKKRIAMMNKTKSARRQLLRMLFLLPATAILLLAFRNKMEASKSEVRKDYQSAKPLEAVKDTVPEQTRPNEKGFYIDIKDNNGNCIVVVKDKNKKEVKRLLLTEWNEKQEYYTNLYGEIPPTPGPAAQSAQLKKSKNAGVSHFNVSNDKITVSLKDGTKEIFNLKDEKDKKQFLDKYEMPVLTENIATTTIVSPSLNTNITPALATTVSGPIAVNSNTVIANANLNTTVTSAAALNTQVESTVNTTAVANLKNGQINVTAPAATTVEALQPTDPIIDDVDIRVTIKKNTKPEELESIIGKLKEKGYDLKFSNKNYNDGILTELSGIIKYKGSSSSFSFSDFDQATIAVYRNGENVNFRIYTGKKKVAL